MLLYLLVWMLGLGVHTSRLLLAFAGSSMRRVLTLQLGLLCFGLRVVAYLCVLVRQLLVVADTTVDSP